MSPKELWVYRPCFPCGNSRDSIVLGVKPVTSRRTVLAANSADPLENNISLHDVQWTAAPLLAIGREDTDGSTWLLAIRQAWRWKKTSTPWRAARMWREQTDMYRCGVWVSVYRLSCDDTSSGIPNRPLNGIVDCARSIRDKEGFCGFYRGFWPASLGVFTYIGCNFAFYESLRPVFVLYETQDTSNHLGHPSVPGQILCATTASLASQCISYPFDVIRRRVQLRGAKWHPELTFPTYESTWHCVKLSVEEEGGGLRGIRSLYRGLLVNTMKALPTAIISFVSYEKLREGVKHSVDEA